MFFLSLLFMYSFSSVFDDFSLVCLLENLPSLDDKLLKLRRNVSITTPLLPVSTTVRYNQMLTSHKVRTDHPP